jgi:hypothetical protein
LLPARHIPPLTVSENSVNPPGAILSKTWPRVGGKPEAAKANGSDHFHSTSPFVPFSGSGFQRAGIPDVPETLQKFMGWGMVGG